MLDQVEKRLLGPMDVVEGDDHRAFARELFDEPARSHEDLVARAFDLALVAAGEAEHLTQRRERCSLTVRRTTPDEDCRHGLDLGEELASES
jgi:hypothetical protein